jgi:hypothetical protein
MRYNIIKDKNDIMNIVTEDGKIVSISYNEMTGELQSTYYSRNLFDTDLDGDIWEQMSEKSQSMKDWGTTLPSIEDVVSDALFWCAVNDTPFVLDSQLFKDVNF